MQLYEFEWVSYVVHLFACILAYLWNNKNGGRFCNVTVGRQRVWSNYGDSDAAIQTAKHCIMGYPSLIMADQVVS